MSVEEKPVVVRVKRKPSQAPLDAFWLEINERPLKKAVLDIGRLSLSDSATKEEAKTKKFLVQHVDTIDNFEVTKDILESFLPSYATSEEHKRRTEDRRHFLKQEKLKQHDLLSTAIQKHEDLGRNARFEQIWKSRRKKGQQIDDSLHEIWHIYDIVHVDAEDESSDSRMVKELGCVAVGDDDCDAILSNYLPLLREFLPTAAAEIESDLALKQGGYVYDIYTVDESKRSNGDASTNYPLVQVDDVDYYDGASESEYDTDDSNAENNDLHDYPDEESSLDEQQSEDDEVDSRDLHYALEGADEGEELMEQFEDEEHENGDASDDGESTGSEYEGPLNVRELEDEIEALRWRFR